MIYSLKKVQEYNIYQVLQKNKYRLFKYKFRFVKKLVIFNQKGIKSYYYKN